MSFGAPYWLFALVLVPVLIALFFNSEQRRWSLLEKMVAARLRAELAGSTSLAKRRLKFFLFLAGLSCVMVSLAEPRYGYTWEQSKRRGRDIIIAIDTSKSMLSTDVVPNRLTRAKLAAQDLVGMLQGDRVGVVAFAGSAFLQAPLTIDYGAVLDTINELDTNTIPRGGTDIAAAIQCAEDAFGKGESENRCMILITDGEDLGNSGVDAARKVSSNFRIFTVGVGSSEGSLIPITDEHGVTTFVKDPTNGEYVKSRLDEPCLRQIAEATGGFYVHLDNGLTTMKQIAGEGLGKVQEREIDVRQSRKPIERYQWPLALGLALLAGSVLINERKRNGDRKKPGPVARASIIALLLIVPSLAFARNNGLDLYDTQDYKDAYQLFQKQLEQNPDSEGLQFDLGTAAYKLGEYDKALDAFSKALTSRDPAMRSNVEYNLGNSLVRRGELQQDKDPKIKEWQSAIQHYDEAIKSDPKNDKAKFNRDLVEKMIKDLQKEPPKQDQNKQDQSKQDQGKQDQGKQDQSKQDQGKQDQGKQDQGKQDQDKQDQGKQQQKDQSGSQEQKDKGGQPQQAQNAQQQPGNDSQQNQAQTSPTPSPNQPDKKLSGEIKEQSSDKNEKPQEPAEAEVQGLPGEMTQAQARALVNSLQNEEQRVNLNEHKGTEPVLKDW